jgi:hypothetical protein
MGIGQLNLLNIKTLIGFTPSALENIEGFEYIHIHYDESANQQSSIFKLDFLEIINLINQNLHEHKPVFLFCPVRVHFINWILNHNFFFSQEKSLLQLPLHIT